jgi:hypothetical protein
MVKKAFETVMIDKDDHDLAELEAKLLRLRDEPDANQFLLSDEAVALQLATVRLVMSLHGSSYEVQDVINGTVSLAGGLIANVIRASGAKDEIKLALAGYALGSLSWVVKAGIGVAGLSDGDEPEPPLPN